MKALFDFWTDLPSRRFNVLPFNTAPDPPSIYSPVNSISAIPIVIRQRMKNESTPFHRACLLLLLLLNYYFLPLQFAMIINFFHFPLLSWRLQFETFRTLVFSFDFFYSLLHLLFCSLVLRTRNRVQRSFSNHFGSLMKQRRTTPDTIVRHIHDDAPADHHRPHHLPPHTFSHHHRNIKHHNNFARLHTRSQLREAPGPFTFFLVFARSAFDLDTIFESTSSSSKACITRSRAADLSARLSTRRRGRPI